VPTQITADVDRCLLIGTDGLEPPTELRDWLAEGLGGVILFARNIADPRQLRRFTDAIRAAAAGAGDDGVLVALDEEGGDVTRLHAADGSPNPGNMALGKAGDPALTARIAAGIGAELRAAGVNLNLAPDADVHTNRDNPVIGIRSFGADPSLVAEHTTAYLNGLRAAGVAGCAKHFPGHGDTAIDSHLALPTVTGDIEPHLVPFRAAIAAGVPAILTAHIVYPALDGAPATLSRPVLTGLLRERLGFDGVVITDSMTMKAIADGVGMAEGAVQALAAGADLICMNSSYAEQREVRDHIVQAVEAGRLSRDRLAEAANRVRTLTALAATWADVADQAPDPEIRPATGEELLAAARAAQVVKGVDGPLNAAPFVLELAAPRRGIELTAGSLLAMLATRDPRVTGARLETATDDRPATDDGLPAGGEASAGVSPEVDAALAGAADRPLVVVIRDAHRDARQRDALLRALDRRPDAIVVSIGTGDDVDLSRGRFIATRGGGRVNLAAAADLLVPSP
jgi:beta-N-acetylhexosaminidase